MKGVLIAAAAIVAVGCTDAERAKFFALGDAGQITCYSGGRVIYEGTATGKIGAEEAGGGGWFFKDFATGQLIRVTGDCVIRN